MDSGRNGEGSARRAETRAKPMKNAEKGADDGNEGLLPLDR